MPRIPRTISSARGRHSRGPVRARRGDLGPRRVRAPPFRPPMSRLLPLPSPTRRSARPPPPLPRREGARSRGRETAPAGAPPPAERRLSSGATTSNFADGRHGGTPTPRAAERSSNAPADGRSGSSTPLAFLPSRQPAVAAPLRCPVMHCTGALRSPPSAAPVPAGAPGSRPARASRAVGIAWGSPGCRLRGGETPARGRPHRGTQRLVERLDRPRRTGTCPREAHHGRHWRAPRRDEVHHPRVGSRTSLGQRRPSPPGPPTRRTGCWRAWWRRARRAAARGLRRPWATWLVWVTLSVSGLNCTVTQRSGLATSSPGRNLSSPFSTACESSFGFIGVRRAARQLPRLVTPRRA